MTNIPPAPEEKWGPGAEQDRFGSRFGLRPGDAEAVKDVLSSGPGAEQDRYGAKFGIRHDNVEQAKRSMFSNSGAEQDRYASHWGLKEETADKIKRNLTSGPGAEQDRYASHWGLSEETAERIKKGLTSGPGAEQDRYASHWSLREETTDRIKKTLTSGPGAEQDRYASHWGLRDETTSRIRGAFSRTNPGPGAEQDRYGSKFGVDAETLANVRESTEFRVRDGVSLDSEQDRLASHFTLKPVNPLSPGSVGAVGILQSTILPSFALNSGLCLAAYLGGRFSDRLDFKDVVRPMGPVANAWWMAVGRRMFYFGITFSKAWNDISYPEKLLLTGVTAQGLKQVFEVVKESVDRGKDDIHYEVAKKEPGFWNKSAFSFFLPEVVYQTIISLPFTLAFRLGPSVALTPVSAIAELAHNLAIFLFGSGFALETIASIQLASHKRANIAGIQREGAWSIVRHPRDLGTIHTHVAFPLLLYSCGLLHPLALLAPVADYLYIRYANGEAIKEPYHEKALRTEDVKTYQQLQQYKKEKNSFWPNVQELKNPWYLVVAGVGVGFVILERGVREYILR